MTDLSVRQYLVERAVDPNEGIRHLAPYVSIISIRDLMHFGSKHGYHEVQGAILEKWKNQGWERGRLGYPISDLEVINLDHLSVQRQNFEDGRITDFGFGTVSAALRYGSEGGGASLPETPYLLTLDNIKCIRQTKNEPGEDELWVQFIVSTNAALNDNGEISKCVDYRNENVNSGSNIPLSLILYSGRLPEVFTLSYMAIEVDLEDDAQVAMNTFFVKVKEDGELWFTTGDATFELILLINGILNNVAGGLILTYGNIWSKVIGGIIGGVVDVALVLIKQWYKSDLIGINMSPFVGEDLLNAYFGKLPLGTGDEPIEVSAYSESMDDKVTELVKVSKRYDNKDLLEDWEYSGTDPEVKYIFTFRHHLYIGNGPVPDPPYELSAEQYDFGFLGHNYDSWVEIFLSWKVISFGDIGYEVERSYHGSPFMRIPLYNGTRLSPPPPANFIDHLSYYTGSRERDDFEVEHGDEIKYRVRAYNNNGYGLYSEILTIIL